MTAPNHALVGALIGLETGNPALAIPLAAVSHFVLDVIPHYGTDGDEAAFLQGRFFKLSLVAQAVVCGVIVLLLALAQPRNWLLAAICAFAAAAPDLFSIPRFRRAQSGMPIAASNRFARFHKDIQWSETPRGIYLEAVWFALFGAFLLTRL